MTPSPSAPVGREKGAADHYALTHDCEVCPECRLENYGCGGFCEPRREGWWWWGARKVADDPESGDDGGCLCWGCIAERFDQDAPIYAFFYAEWSGAEPMCGGIEARRKENGRWEARTYLGLTKRTRTRNRLGDAVRAVQALFPECAEWRAHGEVRP